ncbi:MAG: hypothetical protein RIB84_16525 [Sneathiellaceae bacterium]
MRKLLTPLLALPLLALAATAAQAMDPAKVMTTDAGAVLTDANGMTLYTFDKDGAGMSACYDQCAQAWPPVAAPEGVSGDWSAVERKDGIRQLAYKGQPLYLWVKDTKPGDVTGDGFKDVWHVAKP